MRGSPAPGRGFQGSALGKSASCKTLACRGEREGYGGPRDVTSLSLSKQSRARVGGCFAFKKGPKQSRLSRALPLNAHPFLMGTDAEPLPNDHEDELQLALALSLSEAEAAAARPPRPASAASPRLPDDAWGVCADSLLPHELCCLARASQGLNRAITSCRAYRYLRPFTLTGHAGAVLCVAVAPGGTIVSGSADGWLKE